MNIAHKSLLFENYQFSTLRRSANAMLYIKAEVLQLLLSLSYETVANIQKVPDILERIKENPALSYDKTGLKTIRKETLIGSLPD